MKHNYHAIEGPNGMCACGVKADGTVVTCGGLLEQEIAERHADLLAERDTLKAAIEKMAEGMDRSGGDNYGMPECPWCHCQWEQEKDGSWPHAGDCELLLARFALAACVPSQETK